LLKFFFISSTGITGLVAIIVYYYLVCKILQVDATPSHFVGIAFFVGCIVTLAVARFHHLLLLPTSQYRKFTDHNLGRRKILIATFAIYQNQFERNILPTK